MGKSATFFKTLFAATLVAVSTNSCSLFSANDEASKVTAIPTPRSAAELVLPIDAYELTNEQYAQIQKGVAFGIRDCMKRYGFSVRVPEIKIPTFPKNGARLAWLGDQEVEKYGYRGRPGVAEEMLHASTRTGTPIAVPARQAPVLNGTVHVFSGKLVPPGGCAGEMERRLSGTTQIGQRQEDLNTFHSQANFLARADNRFQRVVQAWSQCMAAYGFKYGALDEPAADRRWNATLNNQEDGGGTVSALEIKTATADLKCREQKNVSGVLLALISAQEKRIIEEKGEVIREISTRLKLRLKNAEKIISGAH
ncbi:hypothetical protein [Actinomadura macrotermitis]|uniref:Uncharacterized protein n=1 Tax=Actinomadura macrotermitis TaxID=2585200 RepID=A0A7K0BTQ6_9ACTN|nr:hypothetical protein [Actinomadura macrotermitis]MQY04527.1 hypothetical protein [Actinomadura macrotermitis]